MSNIDRLLMVLILTDDDVEPQNRVLLSTTSAPDEHGPIARVEIDQRSPRAHNNREVLAEKAVRLLRALDATRVFRMNIQPAGVHMHSTMRMGLSSDNSVLDENAESRWVKRLFVADNSALANGCGGPNPTITSQALATRTAEKVFRLYFDGDPWVEIERPVPSNSRRVTEAVIERGIL
jgi:choline dehydrogenase-like flavoprotein